MTQSSFRPELLLLLLFPLLVTYLALGLFDNKEQAQTQTMDSHMQATFGDSAYSLVRIAGGEDAPPVSKPQRKTIGNLEFSLALALIIGLAGLLGHYLRSRWFWYVIITVALIFTVLGSSYVGIKLTAFFLPNLILAAVLALIITRLFYNGSLIRIRMVLCSILGAIVITLYYRLLYIFTGQEFTAEDWQSRFVVALINLIFITFGMSLADLVITGLARKRVQPLPMAEDEDEDAER
ncbi:MAG TPA: hypothetical protein PKI63_03910 [Candidatus Cloacimonadota bacterium]|nr:hypothetical protein [Candidatus Cloacimonadota bacterium]HOH78655.1 hypothetical protein [Candidatus Cloacimonadota bacterium]